MKTLINYIRSCFCKHDWELLGETDMYRYQTDDMPIGVKWTYRCKKCGYFKVYKNYKE